jgi:hypothetical protein
MLVLIVCYRIQLIRNEKASSQYFLDVLVLVLVLVLVVVVVVVVVVASICVHGLQLMMEQ